MCKLVFSLFILFPALAHADWKSITCIKPQGGLSVTVEFDESVNRVRINGNKVVPASINKVNIFYEETFDKAVFTSTINRSTGTLVVVDSKTSIIDSTYQCSVTKNKF
jgi:hypothetical protein